VWRWTKRWWRGIGWGERSAPLTPQSWGETNGSRCRGGYERTAGAAPGRALCTGQRVAALTPLPPSPDRGRGEGLVGRGGGAGRRPARRSGVGPLPAGQRVRSPASAGRWGGEMGALDGVGVTGRPGRGRFNTCPGPHRPEGSAWGQNKTICSICQCSGEDGTALPGRSLLLRVGSVSHGETHRTARCRVASRPDASRRPVGRAVLQAV
jgi:hypothetical protein